MSRLDVVGLGLSTIDILTPVPRLPGSNDVFEIHGVTLQGGGPVATALVALGKLGASTAYLGTVGGDRWGGMMLEDFALYGVDTAAAIRHAGGASPVSVILVEPDGRRSILYEKGGLPELSPGEVPAGLIESARILHLDGSHPSAALAAAAMARRRGVLVSLDGGAGKDPWPGMEDLLPLVDILVVARQFAARQTGLEDPLQAGPALLAYGARQVVITDGEQGSWYWDAAGQSQRQAAYRVDVVDTTGAGDTYHGAYLYAFLQGWPAQRALGFASAVAALKCTRPGGRQGIPTLAQALGFMDAHP